MARTRSTANGEKTSLPLHWYVFFGIFEPLTVLGGFVYTVLLQDKCYNELISPQYLARVATFGVGKASSSLIGTSTSAKASAWLNVAKHAATTNIAPAAAALTEPTRMALAQLGSCYFLIMLNSALMFYAIRRFLHVRPIEQEHVIRYLLIVLAAADWTHVLFTIQYLPSPPALAGSTIAAFSAKLYILARHWSVWNSLMFGNTVFTLMLFGARAAWWFGLWRESPIHDEAVKGKTR